MASDRLVEINNGLSRWVSCDVPAMESPLVAAAKLDALINGSLQNFQTLK